MSEWISVEDEMPECQLEVLVHRKATDLFLETDSEYMDVLIYAHNEFDGWYDFQADEDENTELFLVTHWMPLPEPPK